MPDKRLAPGMYLTPSNELHIDCPELLRHFGYADTPENRDSVTKAAVAAFRNKFPEIPCDVEMVENGERRQMPGETYGL